MIEGFGRTPELNIDSLSGNQEPQYLSDRQREILFESTDKLVELVRSNKVKDLILVDKSARPYGQAILKHWSKDCPDEKPPSIYFMNPHGRDAWSDLEEASENFKQNFPQLQNDKNEPILIFDVCIHSGLSMGKIYELLKDQGFQNVTAVSLENPNQEVPYPFLNLETGDYGYCKPFGPSLVKNNNDEPNSVVSLSVKQSELRGMEKLEFEMARKTRHEINQTIDQKE